MSRELRVLWSPPYLSRALAQVAFNVTTPLLRYLYGALRTVVRL